MDALNTFGLIQKESEHFCRVLDDIYIAAKTIISGFTYDAILFELLTRQTAGFACGLSGYELAIRPVQLSETLLREWLRKVWMHTYYQGCYIGCWHEAGLMYLDVSVLLTDKNRAMVLGKRNRQQASYDFGNGESVFL